jgi:hypothetical protein
MGIFDSVRKLTKKEKSKERMEKIRESGKQGERNFERDNTFSKIKRVHHGADYEVTVRDSAGRERTEKHEVKRNNSPLSKLQKKTHGLKVDRYEKTPLGDVRKTYNRNGDELKKDPWTGKWNKVRKKDKSMLTSLFESNSSSKSKKTSVTKRKSTARKSTKSRSISDIIFGSSKPKKTSTTKRKSTTKKSTIRKKPKSFSNAESLWGNADSSKPTRKTTKRKSTTKKSTTKKSKGSSNMDWFFGSSSSKSSGKKSKGSSNVDSIWGGSSSSKSTTRKSRKKSSGSSNVDKIWGSGSGKKFKL